MPRPFWRRRIRLGEGRAIVIVPTADVQLPDASPRSIDQLLKLLPAHCIVLSESELPQGSRKGSPATFAETMAMWERLHAPSSPQRRVREVDPIQKIEGYRKTIEVDYACELAHQKLSDVGTQTYKRGNSHRRHDSAELVEGHSGISNANQRASKPHPSDLRKARKSVIRANTLEGEDVVERYDAIYDQDHRKHRVQLPSEYRRLRVVSEHNGDIAES